MNGNVKNTEKQIAFLRRAGKPEIAFSLLRPTSEGVHLPFVIFMGGFRSDMGGTKALHLEECCRNRGQGFIRFDYSGHGHSGGQFSDLTLQDWLEDSRHILKTLTHDKVILVGSSMGGWLGLHLAIENPDSIGGFIGIAAAPDFTDTIINNRLRPDLRAILEHDGKIELPNHYSSDPYIITHDLIRSGDNLRLFGKKHNLSIPMCLLQGGLDEDVAPDTPEKIKEAFPKSKIVIYPLENGDHRLSRPEDLALLDKCVVELSEAICAYK